MRTYNYEETEELIDAAIERAYQNLWGKIKLSTDREQRLELLRIVDAIKAAHSAITTELNRDIKQ